MENTIVQEKQITEKGGTIQYLPSNFRMYDRREPYVKVEFKRIRQEFKNHSLGRNERDLYRTMAYFVEDIDSQEICCSIEELVEESGMSDKPLKRALKALQSKGFISKLSKFGNKGEYRLNIGIFNGIKEKQRRVDLPYVPRVDLPYSHARVMINKTIKKQLLPQSDGSSSSFSKLSERKVMLAKRYVDLLQQNGTEIKGFTVYVESVFEKSERFGTWKNLEQNVKSLEDKISEKETDRLEKEKVEETQRKKLEKEDSENKANTIRRDQVLADIAVLPFEQQETLRMMAQDRLCESNQWIAGKIKSCSNKSFPIIEKMVRNEMIEISQDENLLG